MNLFYHLGLWLYRLTARLVSPFQAKAALFSKGHTGLIARIKREISHDAPIVWFHCASLGEFEQGRPIIEGYRIEKPGHKILLTFFSPSGYEVRKDYEGVDWVFYLPLDTCRNANRFLNTVRPVKAIFVKYEFWFNYLEGLQRRNIPAYVVSSTFRPSQPFFKWYGWFFRRMLKTFSVLFVQDEASKALLNSIDCTNVIVSGDTRFDRVWAQAAQPCDFPVIDAFCQITAKNPAPNMEICVAGSTWPQDEDMLCEAMRKNSCLKLVLVPHEIGAQHIAQIMEQFVSFSPVKYIQAAGSDSLPAIFPENTRVLVVDTIGLLSSIYRFGGMAYVGGGFGNGIHNILEAATYGVPVLFGPNHKKFNEAAALIQLGGAQEVGSGAELSAQIEAWLSRPQECKAAGDIALKYVQRHQGAAKTVLKIIN